MLGNPSRREVVEQSCGRCSSSRAGTMGPGTGNRRCRVQMIDDASCGRHAMGAIAGYGVQMRGVGGPAHSAVCMQPCQAHQIDEERVASDGNHVIKAGCCHHSDRNCCSQGRQCSGSVSLREQMNNAGAETSQPAGRGPLHLRTAHMLTETQQPASRGKSTGRG